MCTYQRNTIEERARQEIRERYRTAIYVEWLLGSARYFIFKQRNKLDPKYHPKGVLNNYKEQVFFCRNGIQKMRCQVYCKWSTLMYQVKLSNLKQHKNTGNSNVSFNFQNKVLEYLVQIEHNSSESQATQVVREVMEIRVRDNGCNCVALPQQYSEIEIYQLYC